MVSSRTDTIRYYISSCNRAVLKFVPAEGFTRVGWEYHYNIITNVYMKKYTLNVEINLKFWEQINEDEYILWKQVN